MNETSHQELLSDNMLDVTSLTIYFVIMGVLALSFLYYLPRYIESYKRNEAVYEESHLFPLFYGTNKILTTVYPIFILFFAFFFSFLGISMNMCAEMYQISISLISIHQFFNDRKPVELRRNLTVEDVISTLAIPFSIIFVKELGTIIVVVRLLLNGPTEMSFLIIYCLTTYIPCQILLFVAMTLQFWMKPPNTHSENIVAAHIAYIGVTKIVVFLITGICYATGFLATTFLLLFVSVDVFLVPLIIEIIEIFPTSYLIQQSNNSSDPSETV